MDKRFNDNIGIFYEIGQLKAIILSNYAKELSTSDLDLLMIVNQKKIKSMKDIFSHTSFSPALVTRITKRLQHRDYLMIDASNKDKRIKSIQITDKGKLIVKIINRELKLFFKKSFANFTDEEIALFLKVVNACHLEFKKMSNNHQGKES